MTDGMIRRGFNILNNGKYDGRNSAQRVETAKLFLARNIPRNISVF